jgi:hypothetical protein
MPDVAPEHGTGGDLSGPSFDPSGDFPLEAKMQMAQDCFETWRQKHCVERAKIIAAFRAKRSWTNSVKTIHYGTFLRQIQLLADIDPVSIKAQFKGVVLTVNLAKDEKAPARTRKIAIEKS